MLLQNEIMFLPSPFYHGLWEHSGAARSPGEGHREHGVGGRKKLIQKFSFC